MDYYDAKVYHKCITLLSPDWNCVKNYIRYRVYAGNIYSKSVYLFTRPQLH